MAQVHPAGASNESKANPVGRSPPTTTPAASTAPSEPMSTSSAFGSSVSTESWKAVVTRTSAIPAIGSETASALSARSISGVVVDTAAAKGKAPPGTAVTVPSRRICSSGAPVAKTPAAGAGPGRRRREEVGGAGPPRGRVERAEGEPGRQVAADDHPGGVDHALGADVGDQGDRLAADDGTAQGRAHPHIGRSDDSVGVGGGHRGEGVPVGVAEGHRGRVDDRPRERGRKHVGGDRQRRGGARVEGAGQASR